MITMRSLPPGAMGPSPHRSPHRHDRPTEDRPRRVHTLLARAGAAVARRRPSRAATPVDAPATTLAD